MSTPIDGGPAFPVGTGHHPDTMMKDPRIGMTLRDYFAAAAMTGCLAGCNKAYPLNPEIAAEYSYRQADAMLAERGRQ